MSTIAKERVQKHRARLKAKGMRPIQIWVPDTRSATFIDECRRQVMLIAKTEEETALLDQVLAGIEEWEA